MDDESHEILPSSSNGEGPVDVDSLGSTPFVSAPSSPGRSGAVPCASSAAHLAYFFSAPASPTHFLLLSSPAGSGYSCNAIAAADLEQTDFEFGLPARSMSTAEELFFNGQIRPGFVSMDHHHHHHASVPHIAPSHCRTRSVSPSRNPRKLWREKRKELDALKQKSESQAGLNSNSMVLGTTNSNWVSASTSRSSSSSSTSSSNSSSASSRRWGFIKDLLTLPRSKSEEKFAVTEKSRPVQRQGIRNRNIFVYGCEGIGSGRRRLTYSASFSPSLCKDTQSQRSADKADAVQFVKEARRRTTFLPYKQHGFLFGCLGFSSRGFVRNVSIPAVVVASRHS